MKNKKQLQDEINKLQKELENLKEFKELTYKGKKYRIYLWENKPFNEFESPKGFRICEFMEVNELIEEDKIVSKEWEVFFTKHWNKKLRDKWAARLYSYTRGVYAGDDILRDSYGNGRVVVVKNKKEKNGEQ